MTESRDKAFSQTRAAAFSARDLDIMSEFLVGYSETDEAYERLEKFTQHFIDNAHSTDFARYAAKPGRFDMTRFRLVPFLAPPLLGKEYGSTHVAYDSAMEVGFPVDAPFAYLIAVLVKPRKDTVDEDQEEEWDTLGVLSFCADLEKRRLKIEQIQVTNILQTSKSMRRHLRVFAGQEPNVSEVLFDIAHTFAKKEGMKVDLRKPEASRRVVRVRDRNGAETPYLRVARKWNLNSSADPTYYVES